jgi:TatA/E family protein of Tat protein translocase
VFGIGGSEFIIIAVIVVMLFGPDKLPKLARTFGRFMSEFKRYQAMMESTLRAEMYLSEEPADPFKKANEYQDKLKLEKDAAAAAEAKEADDANETAGPDQSSEAVEPEVAATPVGETSASVVDGLKFDADGDILYAPEDVGWVPGAPGAPGADSAGDEGEEAEKRP